MNFLKPAAALLLLVSPLSSGWSAQPTTNAHSARKDKNTRTVDVMTKNLGLSPDQQTAMKTVLDEQGAKRRALWAQHKSSGGKVDHQAMRGQMKALREETDQKITAILNDEQKAKYIQQKQGHR